MRHPFRIETRTWRSGAGHIGRSAHAATIDLALKMAGGRAGKASSQKRVTVTTIHSRMVDGSWQEIGAALVTRVDGKVVSLPTASGEWRQLGISPKEGN